MDGDGRNLILLDTKVDLNKKQLTSSPLLTYELITFQKGSSIMEFFILNKQSAINAFLKNTI